MMRAIFIAGRICGLAAFMLANQVAYASDPFFQSFFFDACVNPTGNLAVRCGETTGSSGDLSGDSESSLNPSQNVSSNKTPLANARSKISKAYEHIDDLKNGNAGADDNAAMIGPFSLLINGSRTWIDKDSTTNERGYDGDAYGIELGLDYRLSERALIGGFIGYENTDFDYDKDEAGRNFIPQSNSGTNDADTYSLTVFGAYDFTDRIYAEGSVGASTTDYELERNVVFQESTRTTPQTNVRARGKPDGDGYWFSASTGYAFSNGALSYTPYVRASYISSEIDSYTEKDLNGSGLNMKVDDNTRDSLTTALGIRASYAYNMEWGVLVPQAHFEYEHEFDEDAQKSTSTYVLDASRNRYTIDGDDPDRDYFNAGAGVVAIFPNSWMAFLNYDGLIGYDDIDRHQVTAGIRREF
ncbi:MAG: autotransporter domain-containing protein [Gammaproteobacteria bacterium]|nr:autotransporter domain-containing protein [Gammaproteobacteria bacterium]